MAKMEHEERSGKLAEYVERWDNGVLEVRAYSGVLRVKEDWLEKARRHYPEIPRYVRALIIPLPPDFDWSKINHGESLPDSIIIEECVERWKRKGRKNIRPLTAFLDKPGRTSIKKVCWTGGIGPKGMCWISEKKFMEITKRNLYVDKFYADQIFSRGKDSSGL